MFPAVMPSPRLPNPMDAPPLRWGVLGTGWIAERFTAALHRSTRQRVVAVGSRAVGSATEFADRIGTQRAHGSYADLTADPEVDVVYVATPHNHHRAHALLALDAGKHVLRSAVGQRSPPVVPVGAGQLRTSELGHVSTAPNPDPWWQRWFREAGGVLPPVRENVLALPRER